MKYFINLISLIGLMTAAQLAYSAPITDTYTEGDILTADTLRNIKSAVNDNDTRIAAIAGGADIAVDCSVDANAFINTTITDNTTYTLSGMCNGPIEVFRNRNVVIQGVDTNTKTDGIILPAGITTDPFAAIGVYESSIELSNLRLDASNYVSNSYPWGTTYVGALNVGQQSIARVYDVDLVGGDYTLQSFRNAYVKTYSNVTVTGFNIGGISASYNSHVELNQSIQVVGLASTTSLYPEAVSASYNSSIDIKNGGTFTTPGSGSLTEQYAIAALHNSSIRVRDSGTANINGSLGAGHSSTVQIDGGAVLVGPIDAWDAGVIRFRDSSQSGGEVTALRLGLVRIYGSSSVDTTGFGSIWAGQGSSLSIRNTATVTSGSPISINTNSTLYTRGTVDLGSVGVTCQSQIDQVTISAGATNVGSLAGCP
jgi:hypothetical protein